MLYINYECRIKAVLPEGINRMLSELSIHNYKSIRNVHLLNLPKLGVFVGANAAGKSNLADALDFLSLVFRSGLAGAVRAKGGYENICFRRAKRSKAGLRFRLRATIPEPIPRPRGRKKAIAYTFIYEFAFSTTTQAIVSEYEVIFENIKVSQSINDSVAKEIFSIERQNGHIDVSGKAPDRETGYLILPPRYIRDYVAKPEIAQDELLITSRLSHFPLFYLLISLLSNCGVYQISPYIARGTGIPERSAELGKHGENLPAAVNYLERFQPKAFQELLAHLSHTVPSIEGLVTGYVETKQLGLFFKEHGVGRRWFSDDVSDGTIQTVGIFLPLVDPRKEILFVEEPENSLHPWMLRHFMDSCKAHSEEKQIFITTQSVVAVNEVPLESLYMVTRSQGETSIDRCIDVNPELRQVIVEQLMGLGEYWDSGAIAGVPEYGEQSRLPEDQAIQ